MARIFLTWELGGGSGHLVPMRPIIQGLIRRGHSVVAAVRDLSRAAAILGDCSVRLLQAPFKMGSAGNEMPTPMTLAHLLHNVGYSNEVELRVLVHAWRALFELASPELMICDHSPTALLASRGFLMRRIVLGCGFLCPPDQTPLPNLRFWLKPDLQALARDEQAVLGRMNAVLSGIKQTPIDRLTSIYHDVEATLLTTFEELDQFPWRAKTRYWGAWTVAAGKNPLWPNGNGRRIFAYLKDCPALPQILEWLAGCGHSTLAVVDGVDRTLLQKMSAPTLRFERERLDMSLVAKQCDMAVLHGTHGTTASILAAGKPIMQLPIFLDQGLLAHAVHRMGAGAQAAANNSKAAIAELEKLVSSPAFGVAAQRFATKYAGFDPIEATEQLLDEVERVLRLDGRTLN